MEKKEEFEKSRRDSKEIQYLFERESGKVGERRRRYLEFSVCITGNDMLTYILLIQTSEARREAAFQRMRKRLASGFSILLFIYSFVTSFLQLENVSYKQN